MVVGPLLSISKTRTPATLLPGRLITYTLTVKNNLMDGTQQRPDVIPANNLIITDTFSLKASFVSATAGGVYSSTLHAVIWKIPLLDPGATQVLQFTVAVTDQVDSGALVKNDAINYKVISSELRKPVNGNNGVSTEVLAVLRKTVKDKNGGAVTVYPTEEVTYTFTVYNPLATPLSGVMVTDTLPAGPDPFIYVRTVPGCSEPDSVQDGRKLVFLIDLPGFGSTSCSFVVQVPKYINFVGSSQERSFANSLAAYHPSTYFSPESGLAVVKVLAPLIMSKSVEPVRVLSGDTVTYTIVLNNRGPFLADNIVLTDTLEGSEFHFIDMVQGPEPVPGYDFNPIMWSGLSVPAGTQLELVFTAYADGDWLASYRNSLDAYSPEIDIPFVHLVASVKIDAPLRLGKTVAPNQVFLGQTVQYDVSVTNISDETWRMTQYADTLPTGFKQVGTNNTTVVLTFPPTNYYDIPAGGVWTGSFQAYVATTNCDNLPHASPNAAGAIEVTFTSPINVIATNINNMAPVTVKPNILVDLIPTPRTVQRGDIITYTLIMENVSPINAQDSTVVVTLPVDFTFLGVVQGATQTSATGNPVVITWQHLNIPSGSIQTIIFRVQVPANATYTNKTPTFSGTAAGVCFGKLGSGDNPMGSGTITVVQYVVSMTKVPLIDRITPNALVDYKITFQNDDAYDIVLDVVTDTMPAGFNFISMTQGPLPTLVQGDKIFWTNFTLHPGTTIWKIRLQSGAGYGAYTNKIAAHSPTTLIAPKTSAVVNVLPLFDLKKDSIRSTVLPGSTIPYTITLVNLSEVVYNNILVTDTLPAGMTFYRMRLGYTEPITTGPGGTQPVWLIPQIKANCGSAGCSYRLVFEARVPEDIPLGVYYNQVIGSSPSGSVPGPINTAPITVLQIVARLLMPFISRIGP